MNSQFSIKFAGESGQGVNSMGEILSKSLKNSSYYIFGYREYPSLIKGGVASYQLTFGKYEVNSPTTKCDLLVSISRSSLHHYLNSVKRGGLIVHSIDRLILDPLEKQYLEENEIKIAFINAEEEALLAGGTKLTSNVYLLGLIWNLFGLELQVLQESVLKQFGSKPQYVEMNKNVLLAGFSKENPIQEYRIDRSDKDTSTYATISGNEMIALGSYAAGCRAFYAYPMTPASSILTTLANSYKETGMIVKQVEDEITAVQMTLGSMYMGTRSFTATSGGGFDLMTESLSMSGITEIPLVIVLAQRPGPATGLPTWTSAGDLNLALYSGHGEFPRVVIAASDAKTAYSTIQDAFNIAEKYQVPVILLTEKQIAESIYLVDKLPKSAKIERGLLEDVDSNTQRHNFSMNGVSNRWIPGSSEQLYITNTDEHTVDGSSTENMESAKAMQDKRMMKLETVKSILPEPVLYRELNADISIVGWGSVKGPIIDAIAKIKAKSSYSVSYLHFEYLYPLKTETLEQFMKSAKKTLIVEQNSTAQFAKLINTETSLKFDHEYLRYDGKPISSDEVYDYLNSLSLKA